MGETRDPALGNWTLFEGDTKKSLGRATARLDLFGGDPVCGDISEPLTWPLTLRVGRIKDGVMEGVDVIVNEDLSVEPGTVERLNMRTGESVPREEDART